jgi:hypothetical protein
VSSALPPNYREAIYWRLTGRPALFIALNLLALVGLVLFGAFFAWFAVRFGGAASVAIGGADLLALVTAAFLTLVLHELAHGLAMQAFGARPQYGFMWRSLLAYATAPGHAFTRNQYLAVSLAPLAALSLAALLGMVLKPGPDIAWLLALCAALNASGASGDLWMTAVVAGYPRHAYVVDERDGMRIFLPAI